MASTGSLRNVDSGNKKYGLILPTKSNTATATSNKKGFFKAGINLKIGSGGGGGVFGGGSKKTKPIKVNPLFSQLNDDDDSNDDDNDGDEKISEISMAKKTINKELKAFTKNSNRQVEAEYQKAIEEDPNVYDYDEIYDDMKKEELERRKGKTSEEKEIKRKPKYIASLLEAAERRKKEQLRIEERRIQREREAEGDLYKDKEKFITSGYKEQQEELRRLEEEERKREEQEEANKGNMTGFYRNILNARAHEPIIPNKNEGPNKSHLKKTEKKEKEKEEEEEEEEEKEEKDDVKEAINSGKKVILNDSDEVIDKRQLLNAGLNVSTRKLKLLDKEKEEEERRQKEERRKAYELKREAERKKREEERKRREAIQEQRKRAFEYVQAQKLEKEREKEEEARQAREALSRKMAKKATEDTISEAKRRYLERKKAKQMAQD